MIVIETLMAEDLEYGIGTAVKTHPSGGSLNGHQISLSSFSTVGPAGEAVAALWTPGSIAAGGIASTVLETPGAAFGDKVMASITSLGSDALLISAHVSQANEVTVVLANLTGDSVTLAEGVVSVLVFRHRTKSVV